MMSLSAVLLGRLPHVVRGGVWPVSGPQRAGHGTASLVAILDYNVLCDADDPAGRAGVCQDIHTRLGYFIGTDGVGES